METKTNNLENFYERIDSLGLTDVLNTDEERREALNAVLGELEYQRLLWEETASEGEHEAASFLTFIRVYLREAEEISSKLADEIGAPQIQDIFRKLAALSISAMIQHGIQRRNPNDLNDERLCDLHGVGCED